jgi:crotonobetainyl-CoA:carnitine CoA-transferase CaiB-like acyl-CoA transferase
MTERGELILWALGGMILAAVVMAALHERHYNGRRERIENARLSGLLGSYDARLTVVETILLEDRET